MPLNYTLTDDAGGKFALVGNQLKSATALTAGNYSVTAKATDENGWSKSKVFNINVGAGSAPDVNTVPLFLAGFGDSIIGGSGSYFPFFNRGSIKGAYRYRGRGRPGQYTSVVNSNFDADVASLPVVPDIAVFEVCTNDRGGSTASSIAQASPNGSPGRGLWELRDMVTRWMNGGASRKAIICGINYETGGANIAGVQMINDTIQADISGATYAAFAGRIAYCDMASVMSDPTTKLPLNAAYFSDTIHPSDKGGRIMSAKFLSVLLATGWVSSAEYPWTRNQSVGDARNLGGSGAVFSGAAQGSGAAAGWSWTAAADGLVVPSVVSAAGYGSVGNAQRLTLKAGSTGNATIQRNFSVAAYIGRRIAIMARSSGQNMEDNAAKVQMKMFIAGSNANIAPMNSASYLSPSSLDGDVFHYGEIVVPASSTNLNISFTSWGNSGAGDAIVDFYDLLIMDLGS